MMRRAPSDPSLTSRAQVRDATTRSRAAVTSFLLLVALTAAAGTGAVPPSSPAYEEHLSHHPDLQTESGSPTPSPDTGSAGPMLMDPGVMSRMMREMNMPKPRDLYPSLMSLPVTDPDSIDTARSLAHSRMREATRRLSRSFERLSAALDEDDLATMDAAVEESERALHRFRGTLGAVRTLDAGRAPRAIALDWFRQEMNLNGADPTARIMAFGMSPLHTGIMALLILATVAFIWVYVLKMRRAAVLLDALATNPAARGAEIGVFVTPTEVPEAQKPTAPLSRRQTWSGHLEVIGIFDETAEVKTFRLALPERKSLPFLYEPGQFCTLVLDIDGQQVKRSYTIASSPTQRDYVELSIKREADGTVSRFMHDRVQTGTRIEASLPLGRFFFNGTQADSIVLIAGGVGITPMMSAIRFLTDRMWPGDIYLLYACKTPAQIIFHDELERLAARHPNLRVLISISQPAEGDGWTGLTGHLDAAMIQHSVPDVTSRLFHVCGPPAMMAAVKSHLASLGVPAERVKSEAFGTPVSAGTRAAAPPADTAAYTLRFARADRATTVPAGQTVLEAAEALGIDIDNSCRQGTCGTCMVKLLSGEVTMAVDEALDPEDKEAGYVLACQAQLVTDCEVDA